MSPKEFINQAKKITMYWKNLPEVSEAEKIDGTIFTLLHLIDKQTPFGDDIYLAEMFAKK